VSVSQATATFDLMVKEADGLQQQSETASGVNNNQVKTRIDAFMQMIWDVKSAFQRLTKARSVD
jgi:hypothetical protein